MSGRAPVHGGFTAREAAERGLVWREVLDLSANLAPLPTPPVLLEAARRARLDRYPDPEYRALREALGEFLSLPAESIVPGNGGAELIFVLARLWLREGDRAAIVAPTFSEYERAAAACGAEVRAFWVAPGELPVAEELVRRAELARAKLLFFCNPNNPTGWVLADLARLLESAPPSLRIVVDEAYADFVPGYRSVAELAAGEARVAVVRSFTKCFALPGLRLGCAVAAPEVAEALRRLQPSWSINAVAEAVGRALPVARPHLDRVREEVERAKGRLTEDLRRQGFDVVVGAANFVLLRVGEAARYRALLLDERVCVRDCTSFGLAEWVRVAVPPAHAVERTVRALVAARERMEAGR